MGSVWVCILQGHNWEACPSIRYREGVYDMGQREVVDDKDSIVGFQCRVSLVLSLRELE